MDSVDDQIVEQADVIDIDVIAGLLGKTPATCPVCLGLGTFDRLWPGNEEDCQYCGGEGRVLGSDDYHEGLQRAIAARRAKLLTQQGSDG